MASTLAAPRAQPFHAPVKSVAVQSSKTPSGKVSRLEQFSQAEEKVVPDDK
jgi:hypothetical protein